ncbi:MAG: FAD binding domain-containing protein [Actinomycetota bacterium]
MYPPRFHYEAPTSVDECLRMLAYYREEAKILSGGMSLIPLMKLRFASPANVIDINNIPGLDYIREEGGYLKVGALTRNKTVERDGTVASRYPLMASAVPLISDPVVRNRGTLCGSICHSDPQGDWGSVMLAMSGDVIAASSSGQRSIPVSQLMIGPFTNSLRPDELVVEARIPSPAGTPFGMYQKIERRVGDFATVGVGVHLILSGGAVSQAGIALTGVGPGNIKCTAAEQVLTGASLSEGTIREAGRLAAQAAEPKSDHRGTEEYKREMVHVFVVRALRSAAGARAA